MAFINPTPGNAAQQVIVEINLNSVSGVTSASTAVVLGSGNITIPAITKLTINNSKGTYEWAQLDNSAKQVVTTVSTNSLTTDVVIDGETFFGNASLTNAQKDGISNMSNNGSQIAFKVRVRNPGAAAQYGTTYGGIGYITGIAPSVTADQPVWQSPLTIAVSGNYIIEANVAM